MTAGKYLIARSSEDASERVYVDGVELRGLSKVSVNLEVTVEAEDELIEALRREMAEREIDPDECVGLQGFSGDYQAKYPNWEYNKRLGPLVAVIWHPEAIVPPCLVLDSDGVIYGAVVPDKPD